MKSFADAVAFHGHSCGGLAMGYKLAEYVTELLGLSFSEDEELVCIAETDSCTVDAIQVFLGCTAGKGNLFVNKWGKTAFSFYNRNTWIASTVQESVSAIQTSSSSSEKESPSSSVTYSASL